MFHRVSHLERVCGFSFGVARMRVAVRAVESCRCLSQFALSGTAAGSWRRYACDGRVPVPYSTSVGSNVTGEHVERLGKTKSPLWMSSPLIQSAFTGTPFDGSKCVVGGLEGAIRMEPVTWGMRESRRTRPQVRKPNMALATNDGCKAHWNLI